jgi:subtilisin family serine protease/subtilisin-like proprotein convertase family protein
MFGPSMFGRNRPQKRRTWTFETLEDRHFLSATPLNPLGLTFTSLSSLNPDQAQQILDREIDFSFQVAASQARVNNQIAAATQWIVRTDDFSGENLAAMTGLVYERPYTGMNDTFVLSSAGIDPYVVDAGLANLPQVTSYFPVSNELGLKSRALPTDELFGQQWHLLNTEQEVGNPNFQPIRGVAGEDANVTPAWLELGITGEGVLVAVVDTGVQLDHPDLVANINAALGFDYLGFDSNASPNIDQFDSSGDAHGTEVAGIIAADDNGFGVVGVAPDATIVPIRLIPGDINDIPFGFLSFDERTALTIGHENQLIAVYNHSWGPTDDTRLAIGPEPATAVALRDSVIFGRGGLGNIHIFAAGNGGGPVPEVGFDGFGIWDSAMFDGFVTSRYTIGVTGVDHDGQSANVDGSVTTYPEAGAAVLVAAPTGSFPIDLGNDFFIGSGIWTTDLTGGEDGRNIDPLPSGQEIDNDFLEDTDYTSRFNGTSAAAPIVSGVVALMLQANPNLSFRDVEELLIRSARQNSPGEHPVTGGQLGLAARANPWVVNRIPFFRDPLTYTPIWADVDPDRFLLDDEGNPVLDPETGEPIPLENLYTPIFAGVPNDEAYNELYQLNYIFDPQDNPPPPELFTNGAGYTVSDGRGVYSDQHGYGYGVVDAELAVRLAQQWHSKNQDLADEVTFSTFVDIGDYRVRAAQIGSMAISQLKVPGAITTATNGFINFFEEFAEETEFAEDPDPLPDIPGPDDELEEPDFPEDPSGPFSDTPPVGNARGVPSIPFTVPAEQTMSIEWVEVKMTITGDADAFDYLRIALQSPSGTVSEFNNYFQVQDGEAVSLQDDSLTTASLANPPGTVYEGDTFTWSFNTVRHWGERSDGVWQLFLENWSGSDFVVTGVEVLWHGTPLGEGTQRIQGNVGLDLWSHEEVVSPEIYTSGLVAWIDDFTTRVRTDGQDGDFNFNRYIENTSTFLTESFDQNVYVNDLLSDIYMSDFVDPDGPVVRSFLSTDTVRLADPSQEPFASNVTVELLGKIGEETFVLDQFVTGNDGNFYFDVAAGEGYEYTIRVRDANGNVFNLLTDENVGEGEEIGFQPEWQIAATGEIDLLTGATTIINGLNFLIDPGTPPINQITVAGFVYADIDGDGRQDDVDPALDRVIVYYDSNQSGQYEAAIDQSVLTDATGYYQLDIITTEDARVEIGVVPPGIDWEFADPDEGVISVFDVRGAFVMNDGTNFHVQPPLPPPAAPPGPPGAAGSVLGHVFHDIAQNRIRDPFDAGLGGFTVFLDANENRMLDDDERSTVSNPNGAYFFSKVEPGTYRVEIVEQAPYALTTPLTEYHEITVLVGGTISQLQFGLVNPATRDFGDLLGEGFPTLLEDNGARHDRTANFQLGKLVDAELDGAPTADADGDDLFGEADEDGITVLNAQGNPGGLLSEGENTIRIEVAGVGGRLQGWIDFNGDGDWDDAGEQIFTDLALNPGVHFRTITIPVGSLPEDALAARFRWSEFSGLGYDGDGGRGEVEDYRLETTRSATVSVPISIPGDYDSNGTVETADYDLWKATYGSTSDLRADGNGDGIVSLPDYVFWKNREGNVAAAGSAATSLSPQQRQFAANAYARGEQFNSSIEINSVGSEALVAALLSQGYELAGTDSLGRSSFVRVLTADADEGTGGAAAVSETVLEPQSNGIFSPTSFVASATASAADLAPGRSLGVRPLEAVERFDANLLDVALTDDDRYGSDDKLPGRFGDESDDEAELALAVALDDESDWRYF